MGFNSGFKELNRRVSVVDYVFDFFLYGNCVNWM